MVKKKHKKQVIVEKTEIKQRQMVSFIIIKQRPNLMFYYPMIIPLQLQSMTWIFFKQTEQVVLSDVENKIPNNNNSKNVSLIGSFYPETKDFSYQIQINNEQQTNIDNEIYIKKNRNLKIQEKQQEQEFKPNFMKNKKNKRISQNSNRNVIPNIMHQVVSFLQKKNKSGEIVQLLIQRLGFQPICTVKRFYLYQMLIKEKLNHYVNTESLMMFTQLQQPMCEVYTEQEQRNYNKITRLLIHYFLTHEFDVVILTSRRVCSDKKLDHLLTKRKILSLIPDLFIQQS